MGELLSIGQVADAVGVAPSALRHYDDIGLVTPTTRIGGQRRYTEAHLTRLRVINHCRQAGFTLGEIAVLLDGEEGWHSLARRKRDELQRRIAELIEAARLIDAALDCGCTHLEGCAAEASDGTADARPPDASLTDPTRSLLPLHRTS